MILCLPALRPTPQNQPTLLTKCPAPIIIRVGALASAKNPPKILGPDHHTHEKMGLPRFTHTSRQPSLLLDACQTHSSQVVGKNHAGILFLAWRCLYMLSA